MGAARTALLGGFAVLAAAAPVAFGAAPKQRFFQTSGGAISCELDDGGGLGVDAYCQTVVPPRSVKLSSGGTIHRCSGRNCIGNPPLNVVTLSAGHTIGLGPFSCRVAAAAVSCTVRSGAGFSITRAGVKQL